MKESNFKKAVNEILSFDFSGEGQKAKISEVTSKKSGKKEEPDRAAGEGMKEENRTEKDRQLLLKHRYPFRPERIWPQ